MEMEKVTKLNSDIVEIFTKIAPNFALKQGRKLVTSVNVLLAIVAWAKSNLLNKKKKFIYDKLNSILYEKFNISNKMLLDAFNEMYPSTGDKVMLSSIEYGNDVDDIISSLDKWSRDNGAVADINELIAMLFANKSYILYSYVVSLEELVLDKTGKTIHADEIYNEFVAEFKLQAVVLKSLADVAELESVNNRVKYNTDKFIGMESELQALYNSLGCKEKKSAVLVGKAGTGKTSLVEELARRLNDDNVPEELKGLVIYELLIPKLKSHQAMPGYVEAKIAAIVAKLEDTPNVLVYIDEIHTLYSSVQELNIGNVLKPYISSGKIRIIGATTDDEYNKTIFKDKALARRLRKVHVDEPTDVETKEILSNVLYKYEKYHDITIDENIVDEVVKFSKQYNVNYANPDNALNLLEIACSYCKVNRGGTHVEVSDLEKAIELQYQSKISKDRFEKTRKALTTELLGQSHAIDKILFQLKRADLGLRDFRRPLSVMLLSGPSGTGKTEAARIIARTYFGSDKNLIKINMGEYSMEHDKSKITGSPHGFVGYDDDTSLLSQLKQKPHSVVLFDEVEKAHKDVLKVLLNAIENGEIVDSHGNIVSLKNTVIMFTSNLGNTINFGKESGMGIVKHKGTDEDVMKAIENFFAPEFLGRINQIVIYKTLTKDICKELIERYRVEFNKNAKLDIELTEDDIDSIINKCKIETFGARDLKDNVANQMLINYMSISKEDK